MVGRLRQRRRLTAAAEVVLGVPRPVGTVLHALRNIRLGTADNHEANRRS